MRNAHYEEIGGVIVCCIGWIYLESFYLPRNKQLENDGTQNGFGGMYIFYIEHEMTS